MLSQFDPGKLNTSTPLREDPWKLMPGFLGTSPYAPFSLCWCALYPSTVINHSHEHHVSTLSPVSPPSESSNLVLGIPAQTVSIMCECVCVTDSKPDSKTKTPWTTFTVKLDRFRYPHEPQNILADPTFNSHSPS